MPNSIGNTIRMRFAGVSLGCGFALALLPLQVQSADFSDWHVNGFGTLGATYSSDDNAKFQRDLFQTRGSQGDWSLEPDSVLGLQFSYRPSTDWEAVMQFVSRHDTTRDYTPRITWAYVKYGPDPDLQLRLGRIGWDAFMRADSRNVGYTYLTVRPPIEYYGIIALTHVDGGDVAFKYALGDGVLTVKLFAGLADEESVGTGDENFDLSDSEIVGGYLDYQWRNWQWRLGASTFKFERESPSFAPLLSALRGSGSPAFAALADKLSFEGARIDNWNLGAFYERGALQAQLLYNRRQSETVALADGDNWFGLLAYRIGRFTSYLGHAQSNGEASPSDFAPLPPPQARALATGSLVEQRNWLAGLRYDVTNNVDLKVQVDRVRAPNPQGALFRGDPGWDGDTTVFSVVLDFVF